MVNPTTPNKSEGAEWEREFVEQGAALEHERWAKWQAYLHSKCFTNAEFYGALIIPADLVARWQRQIDTPYADLSEAEKESDRKEARTYLPMVAHQRQQAVAEFAREVVTKAKTKQYGTALLGTPLHTEELMAAVDNTLDDLVADIRTLAKERGIDLTTP